jgi:hypothetical protein
MKAMKLKTKINRPIAHTPDAAKAPQNIETPGVLVFIFSKG